MTRKQLRYEVIYNFVETHMRERISKITISPDNNVIPIKVPESIKFKTMVLNFIIRTSD